MKPLLTWMAIFMVSGILGGMLSSLGWPNEALMIAVAGILLGILIGQLMEE